MERIIGTGSAVPDRVVDNHMLTNYMDTSDAWIRERTGIVSRHIAEQDTVASLAAEAAKRAIEDAGISPKEIGLIIVATSTAEQIYPCVACEVQAAVGAVNAGCFDLNAACSGFLSAYQMACGQIEMGVIGTALLIGSEVLSHVTEGGDRGTAILFGDGAGAVVLTRQDETSNTSPTGDRSGSSSADPAERKKQAFLMRADGKRKAALTGASGIRKTDGRSLYELVNQDKTDGKMPENSCETDASENASKNSPEIFSDFISMDGRGIYQFAVKQVPDTIRELLAMSGQTADEIDYFILHQANQRIIESIAKHLRQPIEKFPMILSDHGNMSSACIPVLLDHMKKSGMLKRGMKLVMSGFGAGLTWAGATLEW